MPENPYKSPEAEEKPWQFPWGCALTTICVVIFLPAVLMLAVTIFFSWYGLPAPH